MTPEIIYWGVVPSVVSAVGVAMTVVASTRRFLIGNILLSAISLALHFYSLYILYLIFILGYYPTYIPHVLIAVGSAVSLTQFIVSFNRRTDP